MKSFKLVLVGPDSKYGWEYIRFKGRCECGNRIKMLTPVPAGKLNMTCGKCGNKHAFDWTGE